MDEPVAVVDVVHTIAMGLIDYLFPHPPVSNLCAATAAAAAPSSPDGADRISCLPDEILCNVISRLPLKAAASTTALSSRWSRLWYSVPLFFADTHLLPSDGRITHPISVTNAVSRVLAAHPGPFHRVDLSCSIMEAHLPELDRWLQLLAAKAVEELVFVNRPWPINLRLPATLFSCTSLRRLYIGVWRFPNTAGLPQGSTAFPHLLELGLCCVLMEDRDLECIISRSPVLEILTVVLSQNVVRLRFVSHSLRCVQLGFSCVADLAAVDAPCLDRLLLSDIWATEGRKFSTRIKIGLAQGLRSLGYLEPGRHLLQIGTTTIKARTRATPSTMVPSVRILALKVYFGTLNEAQMLCSFLQCFPNVETLHLKSDKADELNNATGEHKAMFWKGAGEIECIKSHVKKMVFDEFQGKQSELAFIKFVMERAQVLQKIDIISTNASCTTLEKNKLVLKALDSVKPASKNCQVVYSTHALLEEGGSLIYLVVILLSFDHRGLKL
ncbi:FBD-associated F-box protein At5g60610-like [Oryza glaberrima]|nr:FBD-associated F-box protein At5g60610-like [Oryza glaberrima]